MVLVLVDRSSPAVARRLDALEADVAELGHIVADLLDVSRLDLAPETLRREPVSLEALVDKLAAQVRVVEPARAVEGRGLAGLQWVGDPVLLARALGNLVENARRYDRSGAPIVVEAQVRGPQRVLRVIDQGPGVPEAEREALFEPFRRGAARDDGQGSGLGLTLVRRIARAHGGDATLEANPAGGTVAVLALPAERPPAAPQAPL
jgi:two-component system sensor histidine kinase TctE